MKPPGRSEIYTPPAIVQRAGAPVGAVFVYAGRPLQVVSVRDGATILVELTAWGPSLAGQLCLWAVEAVDAALADRLPPAGS